jgi:hypothetical protein
MVIVNFVVREVEAEERVRCSLIIQEMGVREVIVVVVVAVEEQHLALLFELERVVREEEAR